MKQRVSCCVYEILLYVSCFGFFFDTTELDKNYTYKFRRLPQMFPHLSWNVGLFALQGTPEDLLHYWNWHLHTVERSTCCNRCCVTTIIGPFIFSSDFQPQTSFSKKRKFEDACCQGVLCLITFSKWMMDLLQSELGSKSDVIKHNAFP